MYNKDVGSEIVDWISFVSVEVSGGAVVNKVMNSRVQ
jgi:hypothetical protein